ncbi:penicillin-binding protein activator LpoB [Thiopseudomonas denitrificans]|uniref:Peptidoglycan-synthase activator LpoB n=1 Tax=Thiopseudomonas denitrificans TaxID=1501432 RepID=A0A4R6TYH2_9GAMM|nr:penicillin-binding protein activator LpoB [Thiopseudomonas denitrificans]TDQ37892.1 hypothetical protein DFQ45_106119 [Thiopseudomonas denitrificans]
MKRKIISRGVALAVLTGLSACSTLDVGKNPRLDDLTSIAVVPMVNYTETPDAGQRATSIAQSILHQKGFTGLFTYQQERTGNVLIMDSVELSAAEGLKWARNTGASYALTGAVEEWRYKVGVDGEPVAGLTFNLVDLNSGKTVWSATGSRSGWSRSGVSGVSQKLTNQLLAPLSPSR